MSAQFHPESDPAVLDRFAVEGALAVHGLFGDLVREKAMVALYPATDPDDFVVSRLLDWDERNLRFDFDIDPVRVAALMQAGRLSVVAFLDQVKVQFDADALRLLPNCEPAVLCCAFPRRVFRIQRRDAYRVRPPMQRSVECVARTVDGQQRFHTVTDISASGLSLLIPPGIDPPAIGEVWQHCRLETPGYPALPIDLAVRFVGEGALASGTPSRIGCEFHRPPPEVQRAIQIYVMDVERGRPPPGDTAPPR